MWPYPKSVQNKFKKKTKKEHWCVCWTVVFHSSCLRFFTMPFGPQTEASPSSSASQSLIWLSSNWTRVKGKGRNFSQHTAALGRDFLNVHFSLAILKGDESGPETRLVDSSKWLVGLWNMKLGRPALPRFSFQCKSVRKVSFIHRASDWMSCYKVPQFTGDLFFLKFFFSWKILSNKTRISVKTRRKYTQIYVHNILCTFTQDLKKVQTHGCWFKSVKVPSSLCEM